MIGSEFITYLIAHASNGSERLPPLAQISEETHLGVGKLREQMAVARALGLIEASPKRGIVRLTYDFLPAVRMSLEAGIALNEDCFQDFADLRSRLEVTFWADAVSSLNSQDLDRLSTLCQIASQKLDSEFIEIPHAEHREFHLLIFAKLGNPFVLALLTAYWDAYQIVAPKYYEELNHLRRIWRFHQAITEALLAGDVEKSRALHLEHMRLLELRQGQTKLQDDHTSAQSITVMVEPAGR